MDASRIVVKSRRRAGFGVIEAVVGVALFGALVVAVTITLENAIRQNAKYEHDSEGEILRQYIKKNMDCSATFGAMNPADCGKPNTYIDIVDRDGHKLITADQKTKIGAFETRASCLDADSQLRFEILRHAPDGSISKDPLTGKAGDWFDPFHGIPTVARIGTWGDKLKFENLGAGEGADIGDRNDPTSLNGFIKKNYGISFVAITGGPMVLARVARSGTAHPHFEAWMSVVCGDPPNRNRLCMGGERDPEDPAKFNDWLLSAGASLNTKDIVFDIIYDAPTQNLAFDLADFDGGENWSVTLYDQEVGGNKVAFDMNGRHYPSGTVNIDADGGYGGDTGNNKLTRWSFQPVSRTVRRIHMDGHKNIKLFGLGFDNFTTGLSSCTN